MFDRCNEYQLLDIYSIDVLFFLGNDKIFLLKNSMIGSVHGTYSCR